MIDIFLLTMIIVLSVILIVANIYLLAYYCHPDDKGFGSGFTCKIVVVIGMTLSWAQVLLLPLDVSNIRGFGGEIRMDLLWQVVYISLGVMVLFVVPTCTYFYEADSEWTMWEKIKYSFCYLIVTIIVVIIILIVSYAFLSTAEIPITTINCSFANVNYSNSVSLITTDCLASDSILSVDVSFPIYVIGILSFVSWFLFVLFGGIGLPALPLDFIYDFCTRPKKISKNDVDRIKVTIASDAIKMKDLGKEVKLLEEGGALKKSFLSKEKREYNEKFRKLKAGVLMLDNQYEILQIQNDLNDSWVLQYYFGLVIGIVCLIISLTWFIHILVFIIIKPDGEPVYGFLNILFVYLTENNVSFVATGLFALFCLYLLWATIKGNLKFGLRLLMCMSIHPMKKNETYMNSFLFNVMLILIASVSVTQFCAGAFKEYAIMTDIDLIFSTQIKYLKFFSYFFKYNIFEYTLFGVIILSTIYLLCRPSDVNSVKSILESRNKEKRNLTLHEENSIN